MSSSQKENLPWERLPSAGEQISEYRLVRTPSDGRDLLMICLSHDFVGMRVHYVGRTTPCFGGRDESGNAGCEHCSRSIPKRWRGWLLALVPGTKERIVFEFPALAGVRLDEFFQEYRTLKGLCLIARRPSGKPNGKVVIHTKGIHADAHKISGCPDVKPILERIWGLEAIIAPVAGGMDLQEVSDAETHAPETDRLPLSRSRLVTKPLFKNPNASESSNGHAGEGTVSR